MPKVKVHPLSLTVSVVYLCALAVLVLVQALLGADLVVAMCLAVAAAIALLGTVQREKTPAEIILFGLAVYLGFAGLLLKSIDGQVVQSNLVVPYESSFGLLASVVSIAGGYKLSKLLFYSKVDALRLSAFFSTSAAVRAIAIPLALGSSTLYFAHLMLVGSANDPSEGGFGGFGSFYFLQNVALAFLWAALAWSSKRRYLIIIGAMAVFALIASMIANEKRLLIDFGFVTFLSFIFIKNLRRFWPILAAMGFFAALVSAFLVPAIQATRLQANQIGPLERVDLAWSLIVSADFNPAKLSELSDRETESYKYAFGPNLSYYYPKASNADRFSLIFPLDQVERRPELPPLPISLMFSDLTNLLPGFLVTKSREASVDVIAWHYGIRHYGSVGRPVLGAPASAYAIGGVVGMLILPGLMYFFVFAVARLVGGSLNDSPLGIAVATILFLAVEYPVSGLVGYLVRPVPTLIISLVILRWITYRLPFYRRWLAARTAASNRALSSSKIEAQTNVSTIS